jgi:hypothetical protein
MTGNDSAEPQIQPLAAAALRQSITDREAAKDDEALRHQAEADRELEKLFRQLLEEQVSQKELDDIRQKIIRATDQGKMEVEVMRFPSKLCTDKGRAINNVEPNWPDTLQGKPKSFYDFFLKRGRPQGFKLKAMIVDFPGGVPGDVGLVVSWADKK